MEGRPHQLKTSFPPVLSQYLPEDTPEESSQPEETTASKAEEGAPKLPKLAKASTTKPDPTPHKQCQRGHGKAGRQTGHTTAPAPINREGTSASLRSSSRKKQEAEHLEHVADVWDQARAEVLHERHAALQEKLVLQQRLVRAQDRLSDIRRQEEQERREKRRLEEKQKRQTQESALQDVCKQSLDEDRKKAATEHKAKRRTGVVQAPPAHYSDAASDSSADSVPGGGGPSRARRHPGYRPSQGLPPRQLPSTPMRELEDETDDEVKARQDWKGKDGPGERGQDVPWHHAQLYQLYGKQADYFLHPKPPVVEQRRQTHPKLRHHKVAALRNESGHIGAGELWDTLRQDSTTKLLRNDRRFPQELKAAFSAFVRERLTLRHGRPVERSFCATKDVPDIERLMDQSKLRRLRLYRHKTELMYRSSLNNMDRTAILLNDSPLPEVTEMGQTDSISRYLPSWTDDQSDVSEAEYMKWIHHGQQEAIEDKGKSDDEADKENAHHSAHSRQLSESTKELQSIWQAINTPRKPPKTPRYKFLTEKEAESEGVFSQKFQEERENRDKLQPNRIIPFKSHSTLELSLPTSELSAPESRERGMSARSEMLHRFRSEWQPLSLNALVEYKKQMDTVGEGEFENGRMKMWPVVSFS